MLDDGLVDGDRLRVAVLVLEEFGQAEAVWLGQVWRGRLADDQLVDLDGRRDIAQSQECPLADDEILREDAELSDGVLIG